MKLRFNSNTCSILIAFLFSSTLLFAQPTKGVTPNKQERKDLLEIRRASLGITIPEDAVWLNTTRSRILYEEGRLFIVTTWSPSSLECRDVLNEIEYLTKEYPELQVLLFAIPQNPSEDIELFRKEMLIQGITHPIAVLKSRKGLEMFNFDCFPNTALVREDGTPMIQHCGSGLDKTMRNGVKEILDIYRIAGAANQKTAGTMDVEDRLFYARPLLGYPTFMTFDNNGERLFVSSTGSNKVLVLSMYGEILDVLGSGEKGNADGAFEACAFDQPMGLAYDENTDKLYIADMDNHSIKVADLTTRKVKTVLGSGLKAYESKTELRGVDGRLNYPWDIEMSGTQLLISMAGDHSIWSMDLGSLSAKRVLGSGSKAEVDGKNKKAQFKGIGALTSDNLGNIVAVSPETGKIKRWNRKKLEDFSPVAPKEADLDTINLNFPQGLVMIGNDCWIADTYNNRLVKRDKEGIYSVVAGSAEAGWDDGKAGAASFNLPWDIVRYNGLLYVSDTYNNLIRIFDPESGEVSTMPLLNTIALTELIPSQQDRSSSIFLDEVKLNEGENEIVLHFDIPAGMELVLGGRNEAFMIYSPYNELLSFNAYEGEMIIKADGDHSNVNCTVELFLEFSLSERPETRFFRACRVFMPFSSVNPGELATKKIEFAPLDLLPY